MSAWLSLSSLGRLFILRIKLRLVKNEFVSKRASINQVAVWTWDKAPRGVSIAPRTLILAVYAVLCFAVAGSYVNRLEMSISGLESILQGAYKTDTPSMSTRLKKLQSAQVRTACRSQQKKKASPLRLTFTLFYFKERPFCFRPTSSHVGHWGKVVSWQAGLF